MNEEDFPKLFQAKEIEKKWYSFWSDGNYFQASNTSSKPAYCIVIPPPNVTGVLHMGHALVDTLQDVLIRYKRMDGYEALWVPGTDHAGIATQTIVERELIKTTGKRRKDFSREEFLSHVWKQKEKSETVILSQLKLLGCSCDWSRLAFTMDEKRNRAVSTVFKKMFDDNLIYRGDYLVNWDPITQTALADDEVEYEEQEGFLWHFRYPLENSTEFIEVATTRPETMLGDTAIAVAPNDPRYKPITHLFAIQPLTGRKLPIIQDRSIDPAFGTGAVKITPAHDPTDYQIGLTHNLPMINLLHEDGKMNENAGKFAGMDRTEARGAVVEEMKKLGHLVKVVPHRLRVGISYRSKAVIEPFLSKQWFVRLSQFKELLRSLVETKQVNLVPSSWENTYFHWIDHLRDWCISRQLWWGHRIPIWYHKENPNIVIASDSLEPPEEVKKNPSLYIQEEDVLDTWFSSALWPFSTLGWPEKTADFAKFYPTSTLVTGHDILFFWVARMILMGHYITGKPPFAETFLHGLIYGKSYWRHNKEGQIAYVSPEEKIQFDLGTPLPSEVQSKWEKMSKSKGNVLNPIEIIELYGADAMRLGLCASATNARQIDLDRRKFEEFKNFTTKIWNGARFVFMNIESLSTEELTKGLNLKNLALEDQWILSLLNRTVEQMREAIDTYSFDKAAMLAYDFFWKDFCAYYVELVKPILSGKTGSQEDRNCKQKILTLVLLTTLRLMHPMAPFVTEELFQKLKSKFVGVVQTSVDPYTKEAIEALLSPACIVAPYPVARKEEINPAIEETFAFLNQILVTIRHIRAEMQIPPALATELYIVAPLQDAQIVQKHLSILQALVKLQQVHFVESDPKIPFSADARIGNLLLVIPLPEECKEKEKTRLVKEKEKLINEQNRLRTQLANPSFVERAPPQLVDQMRLQLAQAEKSLLEVVKKIEL